MLASGISIIDRLIQLASVKERNREKYFEKFIDPLFQDAEAIARDYSILLAELIHRLASDEPLETVREWLEGKRRALRPTRVKVRAALEAGLSFSAKTTLNQFKRGIWGLMKGGISAVEDGHAPTGEYGFGDHTVLDLLNHFPYRGTGKNSANWRIRLIDQARKQQRAIDRAWDEAVTSYWSMKRHAFKR